MMTVIFLLQYIQYIHLLTVRLVFQVWPVATATLSAQENE